MMEATWSVALPSEAATIQVPASFFIVSNAALAGAGGILPAFSSPWAASWRARISAGRPRNRRIIVIPFREVRVVGSPNSHATMLSIGKAADRHEEETFRAFFSADRSRRDPLVLRAYPGRLIVGQASACHPREKSRTAG